ncbi:MAG: hypothetical protein HY347_06115 [candidate division NC10 bacterium]|nr:hypothetical protein [candidate division NC10 bacterium]
MGVRVFEDFTEPETRLEASAGSGPYQVVDGAGGLVEMEAASGGDFCQLYTRHLFQVKHLPVVVARLRTTQIGGDQEVFLGLFYGPSAANPTDALGFWRSDGADSVGTWKCRARAMASGYDAETGILGDDQEVELALVVAPLAVQFLVNGRVVHVETEQNFIPDGGLTGHLRLGVYLGRVSGAGGSRTLEVDYLGVWSGR